MSHSRSARREEVDSWLLVAGSQTASLTPGPSFAHNLGWRCPNGSCETILDIYTLRYFQWYEERTDVRRFDPSNRLLNFRESRRTPSLPLLGVWIAFSHLASKWGCDRSFDNPNIRFFWVWKQHFTQGNWEWSSDFKSYHGCNNLNDYSYSFSLVGSLEHGITVVTNSYGGLFVQSSHGCHAKFFFVFVRTIVLAWLWRLNSWTGCKRYTTFRVTCPFICNLVKDVSFHI